MRKWTLGILGVWLVLLGTRGLSIHIAHSLGLHGSSLNDGIWFYVGSPIAALWALAPDTFDSVFYDGWLVFEVVGVVLMWAALRATRQIGKFGNSDQSAWWRKRVVLIVVGIYVTLIGLEGVAIVVLGMEEGLPWNRMWFPDSLHLIIWWAWPVFVGAGALMLGKAIRYRRTG